MSVSPPRLAEWARVLFQSYTQAELLRQSAEALGLYFYPPMEAIMAHKFSTTAICDNEKCRREQTVECTAFDVQDDHVPPPIGWVAVRRYMFCTLDCARLGKVQHQARKIQEAIQHIDASWIPVVVTARHEPPTVNQEMLSRPHG